MLRHTPQYAGDLRLLLELVSCGQHLRGEHRTRLDAAEIAMRDFRTGPPAYASTAMRCQREAGPAAAHVETGQQWSGTRKPVAYRPIFVAQIGHQLPAVSRAVLPGAGEMREDAPLLRVPAKHGIEVDRLPAQVPESRLNSLKRQSAQQQEEVLPTVAARSVELAGPKRDIETAVVARAQIELKLGEDTQAVQARNRVQILRQQQRAGRRKRKRMVQ